jgi:hypothetical protein
MEKFSKLIEDGEVRLFSNIQIRREIERNRHGKILDGLKPIRGLKYGHEFPNFCKGYPEHGALTDLLKKANALHKELLAGVDKDIRDRKLQADILIGRILAASTPLEVNKSVIDEARLRVELGNPPGKSRSLGDAIHWECLLRSPSGHVSLVSKDSDFSSPLHPDEMDPFLIEEWRTSKSAKHGKYAKIQLYETLSGFLKAHFPKFELSVEAKKDELIEQLRSSPSFSTTHKLIVALSQLTPFTAAQSRKLCHVLIENNQVHLIAKDDDVQNLYKIVKDKAWQLTDDAIAEECDKHLGWPAGDMSFPF